MSDDSHKNMSGDDVDYDGEDEEKIPEAEIFDQEFIDRIHEAKMCNASAFQSYWEADENDISKWTKKEISLDPLKNFIYSAEMGNLDVMKELVAQISITKKHIEWLSGS